MKYFSMVMIALTSLALSACSEVQEAVAADKGTIKIVTDPGDAKIFINGKRKGNAPSEPGQTFAIKLEEGEYKIEVIKTHR